MAIETVAAVPTHCRLKLAPKITIDVTRAAVAGQSQVPIHGFSGCCSPAAAPTFDVSPGMAASVVQTQRRERC